MFNCFTLFLNLVSDPLKVVHRLISKHFGVELGEYVHCFCHASKITSGEAVLVYCYCHLLVLVYCADACHNWISLRQTIDELVR